MSTDDLDAEPSWSQARRERQRWENEEPVGPLGETRAQVRALLMKDLEQLRKDVQRGTSTGALPEGEAATLRLRIHREYAALAGLSTAHYGYGSTW